MTIRVAIIGSGVMGADHAQILAEDIPGTTLQVVCDRDENRARTIAETYGAIDISSDPDATIRRSDVDAVFIASPDFTHTPLSLACIRSGKPALCEKPLSQSSGDCLSVMDAEMKSGQRWVQLGFMRRYDQSYQEMKAALARGLIGRALMMHNFHRNVETPASDFTGAMAITNSAPHEFDVARFILKSEFASISAFQPSRSDARVAPVFMVLETRDQQLVTIEINNNADYGYDVRGELVGEAGSVSLNAPVHSRLDANRQQTTGYAMDWRPRYREAYRRQNKAFVSFVKNGRFPSIASSPWDGYAAAVTAEAGAAALREGRKVAIEMIDRPEFYANGEDTAQ